MIIFTDASFSQESKVSGLGFVIIDKQFSFKAGNYDFQCINNNISELRCIEEALNYCKKFDLFHKTKDKTLTIITDSKYSVDKINNPKNLKDPKEIEILNHIHSLLDQCPIKRKNLFEIKGHTGGKDKFSHYNDLCDQIASSYRYLGEIEKVKYQALQEKRKRKREWLILNIADQILKS